MLIGWYRPEHHKDQKLKDSFTTSLQNSRVITTRYLEILHQQLELLDKYEEDVENLSDNWVIKQAFLNGQRSQIKKAIALFTFNTEN